MTLFQCRLALSRIVALAPLGAMLTSLRLAACVLAILTLVAAAETRNQLADTAATA